MKHAGKISDKGISITVSVKFFDDDGDSLY